LFSPQIPLQLQPPRPDRFEDFIPGPNQAVVDALRDLSSQRGESLYLHGPPSSGKTHLLNALCVELRQQESNAWYIGLERLRPEARAGLKGLQGLVCFDGLHAVAGDRQWEEALFHSFNEVREGGGQVAVSSRIPLSGLDFALPDLASRMGWGARFKLELLDEGERLQVLKRRAASLELELPDEVQAFLLRRISRDLGSLLDALEKLHRAALADKRRVTVPLARQVLAKELSGD
jgi:DnaA family protein